MNRKTIRCGDRHIQCSAEKQVIRFQGFIKAIIHNVVNALFYAGPEFKSTPWNGHPLFNAFIKAAVDHQSEGKNLKAVA